MSNVAPCRFTLRLPAILVAGGVLLCALITAIDGLCFTLDPDPQRQHKAFGIFLMAVSAIPWITLFAWLSQRLVRHQLANYSLFVALRNWSLIFACAVTIFLWVRSDFFADQIVMRSSPRPWLIILDQGIFQFGQGTPHGPIHFEWLTFPQKDYPEHPEWFFYFAHNTTGWAIGIPLWFCVIVPAGLFACSFRRRTPPPGFCKKCGYDLRATPNCCPECGTTPIHSAITPLTR